MPTVPINGFELYYEVHGKGPSVVFAHGVGGNHAIWFNQIPVFAQSYQVVVFDHRGFGNSRDATNGPGRSRFVEDLKALLDHLGIERTTLVAQSMGGGTCTGFTFRYPERVSALVLADTIIGIKLPDQLVSRMAKVRKVTEKLSQLERVLSPTFREKEPVRSQLYAQINSFNSVNRLNLGGSFGTGHTPQELADTKVPVMFVVGRDDILIPPDVVAATHQSIPGSQFLEVPNCSHSVYFEDPKTFNEAIIGFLKAVGVERQPFS